MTTYTATYSPDDNKIRLYASARLDAETYAEVKASGFRWAPKQELFYATWDIQAEDMALKLAGEIGDEDKSLVERAEERAERFEVYSEKREAEANRAQEQVQAISGRFEFGQPILVGHHSERKARKDAKRISNSLRPQIEIVKGYIRDAQRSFDGDGYVFKTAVKELRQAGWKIEFNRLNCNYTNQGKVG